MAETNIQALPGGIIVRSYKLPIPGVRKKILYHFSDTHLSQYDALSSQEEKQRAEETAAAWCKGRENFAHQYSQPCTDAQKCSAERHFRNLLDYAAADGDAIVLCGDIFDYVSGANLRFFDAALTGLSAPCMAVSGNHEAPGDIPPEGHRFSQVTSPVQVLELEDLIILGFDNSRREITREQNARLREILELGKPVILAMHVPIMTDGNRDILFSCGEYFRLNHPDATPETLEFIELLKCSAPQIIAVLAGHLHFPNDSEIVPGLTQYVSSQGILGNINRYEIGEPDLT